MRKIIRDILVVILVPIILFFLVETFFRAYLISPSQINSWGYNPNGFGDLLPSRNFIADEGPLPYRVITNSQGLRSDKEFAIPKPAGVFRVLTIGDSLTFGPYVNQQDTYPAHLEQDLKALQINAEVINAGISGYTLADELSYLIEKGIQLQPDLVILEVYQNDVSDYTPALRKVNSREAHKKISVFPLYNLLKRSAVITYFETALARTKLPSVRSQVSDTSAIGLTDDNFDAYFRDLEKLKIFLNRSNQKALFVFFPSPEQTGGTDYLPQSRIMKRIAIDSATLDLLPVFKKETNLSALYLLPANSHFSAYGNFVTASAIASEAAKIYNKQ